MFIKSVTHLLQTHHINSYAWSKENVTKKISEVYFAQDIKAIKNYKRILKRNNLKWNKKRKQKRRLFVQFMLKMKNNIDCFIFNNNFKLKNTVLLHMIRSKSDNIENYFINDGLNNAMWHGESNQ
jgi:hypothetical protein